MGDQSPPDVPATLPLKDVRPRPGVRRPVNVGLAPEPFPEPLIGRIGPIAGAEDSQKPLTWGQYTAWRRSKCPPPESRVVWLDEMDQAIHEFVGEVAELAQVVLQAGPHLLIDEQARKMVTDELGDAIFCGTWVFDSIDEAFFDSRGSIAKGFVPPEMRLEIEASHRVALKSTADQIQSPGDVPDEIREGVLSWCFEVQSTLMTLLISVGLLSNRFKKQRWQRMPQDPHAQAESVFNAFVALDALCVLARLSLVDCAVANQAKLDKRFPDGWQTGGGLRT